MSANYKPLTQDLFNATAPALVPPVTGPQAGDEEEQLIAKLVYLLSQGAGGGAYTAGDGLQLNGNEFSVEPTDNQVVVPIEGGTIQMTNTDQNGVLYINNDDPITNLEIILPTESNSKLNQIRRIFAKNNIGTLDFHGEEGVTIHNNVESIEAKSFFTFQRINTLEWARQTS